MVRRLLLLLLVLAGALAPAAAAAPLDPAALLAPWTPVAGELAARGPGGARVETRPAAFAAYTLNRSSLEPRLALAPPEEAGRASLTISIPAPDGTLQRFAAVDSPVMAPGLGRRHPEIVGTFAAVGIDDPSATARLSLTSLGFHATVRSARGSWHVDPYYRGEDVTHVSYFARDLANTQGPLVEPEPIVSDAALEATDPPRRAPGDLVVKRTYRLALISDPEYATYHGAENVTSAKVTLMNRVNQLYNDDLAIRMELIAANDALNLNTEAAYSGLLGPCGLPCYPTLNQPELGTDTGESCDLQTLAQNNVVANALVGPTSYDIGHLVLGRSPGGVALLGSVGDPTTKASGCTGLLTPVGDFFAIDYVAHEMGHQFGGNHTFNGNQHNCSGGNRNEDTSVEPGSGSSIQAYAGICRQDNLQPHSDPYFSQRSIDEIQAYVTGGGPGTEEGDVVTTTTNHSPVVTAPMAKTIPIRTPFMLTGSATDSDGNPLIYLWEQNDVGTGAGVALTNNTKPANGPLFRVFGTYANVTPEGALLYPSPGENQATAADVTRTFPDVAQILSGTTNAADGTCPPVTLAPPSPAPAPPPLAIPIIDCYSEFLPTAPRAMNFRLTARDRAAVGGGVSFADTTITAAGTAPFQVTSQTTPESVAASSQLPVVWDVAATDVAPIGVAEVRISYSTDGGQTFPTVLLASTPNDGSEAVTVPAGATSQGRVKVEAIGNYFFDMSDANLTVTVATPTPTPSASPTASPTPTAAASATATATATASASATATASASASPTRTPVPTATSIATVIPTPYGVDRLKPTLAIRVKPRRDRRAPFRFRASGRLRLPAGVAPAAGCSGRVRIVTKKGRRVVRRKTRAVRSTCDFATRANFRTARKLRGRRGKLKFRFRYAGNAVLLPARASRSVRYGR